jgi:hypothetical protein
VWCATEFASAKKKTKSKINEECRRDFLLKLEAEMKIHAMMKYILCMCFPSGQERQIKVLTLNWHRLIKREEKDT